MRLLQAVCVVILASVARPQGYDDEIEVNYADSYFNEIPAGEEQGAWASTATPTAAVPCKPGEFTKWDKLFTMLENSQMKENMLLQHTDDIIKVELQSLRSEMLDFMRSYGGSCSRALETSCLNANAQLEQQLRKVGEEQRKAQEARLQQLLAAGRSQTLQLAKLENACLGRKNSDDKSNILPRHLRQEVTAVDAEEGEYEGWLEQALVTMATELRGVKDRLDDLTRAAGGRMLPAGCDMALLFPMRSLKTHAEVAPQGVVGLRALTVCLWVKPTQALNKTVLFSYGTAGNPLELQLVLGARSTLFTVAGEAHLVEARGPVEEGRWRHLCGAWSSEQGLASLWVDGRKAASSPGVAEGHALSAGGVMLLGQEHSSVRGTWRLGRQDVFDTDLAFAGRMTGVNMWSRVLGEEEISLQARRDGHTCGRRGDVVAWGVTQIMPRGGVEFVY